MSENKNTIDISLDELLSEHFDKNILSEQVGAGGVPMPDGNQIKAFYNALSAATRGRTGSRTAVSAFNRLADRMFGPGVDTQQLHDIMHQQYPQMDLPGRSALRTGTRFLDAASNVVKKGADIVKKGATAKGIAATKLGAAAGGGMGLGTGLAVAGGAVAAGAAARAAWNIWHSKMKPQVDSLEATLDELQARTTKLQSKAFTQAMAGFNQRFDTAMKGAAFRDSDRVILGQAMALIDFYNNLAQTMFKVQKMQAARDISGTGGKIGVAGGNVKIMEEPGLKEEYSLQELFGFGKKKEQEFQSDDTPDDDTTTSDSKTDSKKDNAKNWESKVNSVFSTLRAGTLSGAPSKFTGAIKNMWATIGFKPAKTNLPPEFNEQAIDSLIAGFLNTILAPGSGGAQGALKLSEMATGIDECLGKTLMEMSAKYDLAVLTEDLQAFMLRTPDLSAIADETAQAATPPPPADSQEIKKVVAQTSPEGDKGVDSAGVPGAAPKSAPGVAPGGAPKGAAPAPKQPVSNLLDDATLRKIAPAALQLFQSQTQDRKKFTTAAANGAIRIGKKPIKLNPEQSKQVIDFIKGNIGADRSGGGVIASGGQGVDMVGPNSSVAASLQDPTLMAKNKQRMQFIRDLTPSSRAARPIGIQSFLQAAKAGVVNPQTGGLKIPQYGIYLNPAQQQQAKALGLLERLYKLMGAMTLLENKIATLINSKSIIKESAKLIETNNKIEIFIAYQKQVEKALKETIFKIGLLDVNINAQYNQA